MAMVYSNRPTSPTVNIAVPHSSSHGISSPKTRGFQMLHVSDESEEERNDGEGLEQIQTTQSSLVEYRVYKMRWAGLAVLMSMNLVISWGWLTFAPVSEASRQYYGLGSLTPVNWLSTVILFAYPVASPMVIYTVNKYGIKGTIWIASFLTLLGFWMRYIGTKVGTGGQGTFGLVMFGQILIGLAQPFVLNTPAYYSDLWFTSNGRVSATALASLANPLGAAVGQLVNPFLATKASEIPSMVLYTAVIATIPCLLALLIPKRPLTPPCASSSEKKLPTKTALRVVAKSKQFWLIFLLFSVYSGFFNAYSSLINQIYEPYGYSTDHCGFIGAVLIVVGLIGAAVLSPLIDRTHAFIPAIRILVPIIGLSYIAIIFTPVSPPNLAGAMIVCGFLGAAAFSLLPLSLEYSIEQTHPASPEITSTILWSGGQLLGGIFLVVMDAMRDEVGTGVRPKRNLWAATVFEGVLATLVVPGAFLIKKRQSGKGRVEVDREAARAAAAAASR